MDEQSDDDDQLPIPTDDLVLAALVKAANTDAFEFGVTLYTSGGVVTGIAFAGRHWTETIASMLDSETDQSGLADAFRVIGQRFYPSDSEVEAGVETYVHPDQLPKFVHLRDARVVFAGGAMLPSGNDGTYMRINMDHVVGWTLGVLAPPGYSAPPPAT